MARAVFRLWTPERRARADELLDKGYRNPYVAAQLGLSLPQVEGYVYGIRGRHAHRTRPAVTSQRVEPTPAAVIDRERRLVAREARNLTAQFFGDPPPGYSALDRKNLENNEAKPQARSPSLTATTGGS